MFNIILAAVETNSICSSELPYSFRLFMQKIDPLFEFLVEPAFTTRDKIFSDTRIYMCNQYILQRRLKNCICWFVSLGTIIAIFVDYYT